MPPKGKNKGKGKRVCKPTPEVDKEKLQVLKGSVAQRAANCLNRLVINKKEVDASAYLIHQRSFGVVSECLLSSSL
jgi:hypothetical protein